MKESQENEAEIPISVNQDHLSHIFQHLENFDPSTVDTDLIFDLVKNSKKIPKNIDVLFPRNGVYKSATSI
jgi:hypothetical protein